VLSDSPRLRAVIHIQKSAKPRGLLCDSGVQAQTSEANFGYRALPHWAYGSRGNICAYLQHLDAENNVRPLFPTAMPRYGRTRVAPK
jgi:hypothetical protein